MSWRRVRAPLPGWALFQRTGHVRQSLVVLCASCPAIEELAAKDARLVALQEENDVLRAKVAALVEIAFGGSERRGGAGRAEDGDLDDLDDDCSPGEGDAGEPSGPASDSEAEADDEAGGTRRRGQRRGAPGHGRCRYGHLGVKVASTSWTRTSAAVRAVARPTSRSPATRSRARSLGVSWSTASSIAGGAIAAAVTARGLR